ncbi:CHAP domain-containing protein, partial [Dysosmobacter welbionis]
APGRRHRRTHCRTAGAPQPRWPPAPGRLRRQILPPRTPPRAGAAPAPGPRRSPRQPWPGRVCAAGRSPPAARSSRSSRRPWPCPVPAPPGLPPEAAGARCGADCILRLYLRPPWISPLPNDKKVTVRCQSRQFFINTARMGLFFDHTILSGKRPAGPIPGCSAASRRRCAGTSPAKKRRFVQNSGCNRGNLWYNEKCAGTRPAGVRVPFQPGICLQFIRCGDVHGHFQKRGDGKHEHSGYQRWQLFLEVSAAESRDRRPAGQGPVRTDRHRRQVHL